MSRFVVIALAVLGWCVRRLLYLKGKREKKLAGGAIQFPVDVRVALLINDHRDHHEIDDPFAYRLLNELEQKVAHPFFKRKRERVVLQSPHAPPPREGRAVDVLVLCDLDSHVVEAGQIMKNPGSIAVEYPVMCVYLSIYTRVQPADPEIRLLPAIPLDCSEAAAMSAAAIICEVILKHQLHKDDLPV